MRLTPYDLAGFPALIQRLRAADERVVYAPAYLRDIEEPIAAAIAVERATPIVIVEGNYLLANQPDLTFAHSLLDEVWYVQTDDQTRVHRLIQRHIQFGKTHTHASLNNDARRYTPLQPSSQRASPT